MKSPDQIFDEVVDLPPAQRLAALEAASIDPGTRSDIESLLRAHDDAGEFFCEGARAFEAVSDGYDVGALLGPHKLLELLGEGGFARVFRAHQSQPVHRDVALKLLKLGMDSRAILARFAQERQALAAMHHPNIAAFYDAGTTTTGRPYFVMELVAGQRITVYCRNSQLDIPQRIELFIDVCHAVQHAHTKGLLHRDIKPSNILISTVDQRPVAKVIDFGIAKALQPRLHDSTVFTQSHQLLGTPQYMSPEQARSGGAEVDTRSDVYSLGTVLFEVVTGAPPLRVTSGATNVLDELQRLTSDDESPTPSSRVDDDLRRALRGDLDWIVGKCLEKDPARRYESCAALAADLQAYLQHRPIAAAPPGRVYQAKKFIRRNSLAVAAGGVVLLTLLVSTIVSTTMAVRATRAERLAQKRLDDVEAVNQFLTQDVIGSAQPAVTLGRPMSVRDALDNASAALAKKFSGRPLTEAVVRDSVAMAYLTLGRADLALPHAQRVLDQRRSLLGTDHPETIRAVNHYALVLNDLGRQAEAEPLVKRALEDSRRVNGVDDFETIHAMDIYAGILVALGRTAEAEPLRRQVWQQAQRVLGSDHHKTLTTQNNFAHLLQQTGRPAEAEPLFRDLANRSAQLLGKDNPASITALNNHALVLKELGRYSDAEPLYKEAWERRRRVLGDDHSETLISMQNYAALLRTMARNSEAEPIYRDVLERRKRTQGDDHPLTLAAMNAMGELLGVTGRVDEAELVQRETLERRRRVLGNDHRDTLTSMNNYAVLLQSMGRSAEAESLHEQALATRRRVLGDSHPHTLVSINNYVDLLRSLGKYAQAEPLAAELYRKAQSAQIAPGVAAIYMSHYGPCLVALERFDEAEAPLIEAIRRFREANQAGDAHMRALLNGLADVLDRRNQRDQAEQLRAEAQGLPPARATTLPSSR